jgi:hypothetical protein
MKPLYPGYDVQAKRDTPSWNQATRDAIDRRLAVPREPRFFTAEEWITLEALCDRVLPQPPDRPKVPLPAYLDQRLAENVQDGFRYAVLPPQGEAWRRGLRALEEAAQASFGQAFSALPAERQDDLLRGMQTGALVGEALGDMPSGAFFAHRLLPDITHAYYATPTAWNEIGFGGPASPRGYVRMALNRRDPWEAVEAQGPDDAKALRDNRRVR